MATALSLSEADFEENDVSRRLVDEPAPPPGWRRRSVVQSIYRYSSTVEFAATFPVDPTFDSATWASGLSLGWNHSDGSQAVFSAVERLYLQQNSRDRRIAERLARLYWDALADGETISASSIAQFADFFVNNTWVGMPKITLTPDGTLRARWIARPTNFTAIEFTGIPIVKLVAEIPRSLGVSAQYFGSEVVSNVVQAARDLGASFAGS